MNKETYSSTFLKEVYYDKFGKVLLNELQGNSKAV